MKYEINMKCVCWGFQVCLVFCCKQKHFFSFFLHEVISATNGEIKSESIQTDELLQNQIRKLGQRSPRESDVQLEKTSDTTGNTQYSQKTHKKHTNTNRGVFPAVL